MTALKQAAAPIHAAVAENYGKLPLSFEANQGQSDPQVKFLSRGNGYSLFLTDSSAVLALTKWDVSNAMTGRVIGNGSKPTSVPQPRKTDVVRMELAGASRNIHVAGTDQLPGKANYFIGSDPARWHSGVPTYAKVQYTGVYPGVDLVYYGSQRQLEYDFVVAPGANPKPIRLQFVGAKRLKLTADGDLTVSAENGEVTFHKPVIFQGRDDKRQPVEGRFSLLTKNTVGFKLGQYDPAKPLVIDPVLAYSTYLGGSGDDSGRAIAVDSSGDAYVTGYAESTNFPVTAGAFQTTKGVTGSGNAFITKFNPAGTALLYSTYLGGSVSDCAGAGDIGNGIAVDSSGDAYVTGETCTVNFPVTTYGFQTANRGAAHQVSNAFVTKLNPSGSELVYSTYLGGSGTVNPSNQSATGDWGRGIAVDGSGDAYVTGIACSLDFPVTAGAFQTQNNSGEPGSFTENAFVTKFNPVGSELLYSTYLGGSEEDYAVGIAIDNLGDAYVTGTATSPYFPTTAGAFQPMLNGPIGNLNAFVTKLNPTGTALLYSTFLGGSNHDFGAGIALDSSYDAYVTGTASSTDFPVTVGAFQTKGGDAAFVTKLNPTGSALLYSTYLGGTGGAGGNSIAVDGSDDVYVTGLAGSSNFPVTPGAFQTVNNAAPAGDTNAFVTEFNPTGTALLYSTYLGGSGNGQNNGGDSGNGIAVDGPGNAYVTGLAVSPNFPVTVGAYQTAIPPGQYFPSNAFVAKLHLDVETTTPTVTVTPSLTSITTEELLPVAVAVSGGSGNPTPTGSVTLSSGNYSSAALTYTLSGGSTTIHVPAGSLEVGTDTLTATYTPDFNSSQNYFTATGTTTVEVTVSTLPTPLVSVTPSAADITSAQPLSLAIRVSGGNGNPTTPTGSITMISGSYASAATTISGGSATINIPAGSLAVGNDTLTVNYTPDSSSSSTYNSAFGTASITVTPSTASGLQFVPVTPCRIADTREATGPFGGPALGMGVTREFDIPQSACQIPTSAVAYSLNVTVVPNGPLGYLTIWPSGQPQPLVSTLNSDGRVKANAAITPAGTNGGVSVYVTDETQVILDIDGYFVAEGTASALAFYPVTPCRVVDTRNAVGPLGGPFMAAGTSRAFPVQSSGCGLPADAQVYSLNVTVVPRGDLGYLTMWPSGEPQPLVSTLNASTGTYTANAAIVPAATNGDVSIYVSNSTDVVLDVDGYFAAPATGGLSLYTTTPCRVLDTRQNSGAFNGVLAVAVATSACGPSSSARAYVLNATVVPPGALGFLTLWPDGEIQPTVSTLNAIDGAVTSNMAIVPTVDGKIDAFSSDPTQLVLDLSSYFAP